MHVIEKGRERNGDTMVTREEEEEDAYDVEEDGKKRARGYERKKRVTECHGGIKSIRSWRENGGEELGDRRQEKSVTGGEWKGKGKEDCGIVWTGKFKEAEDDKMQEEENMQEGEEKEQVDGIKRRCKEDKGDFLFIYI